MFRTSLLSRINASLGYFVDASSAKNNCAGTAECVCVCVCVGGGGGGQGGTCPPNIFKIIKN